MAKYLVIDIDACALSVCSSREDGLSQWLIDFAKTGNYQGFYICTHRSRHSAVLNVNNQINSFNETKDWRRTEIASENFFISSVAKNFSDATNLNLFAVSTPDDLAKGAKCGSGYEDLILPHENKVILEKKKREEEDKRERKKTLRKEKDKGLYPYGKLYPKVKESDSSTKNPQLEQIVQHIQSRPKEPDEIDEIDFVDDRLDLCENTAELILSDRVAFTAYQHQSWGDNKEEIKKISVAKGRNLLATEAVTSVAKKKKITNREEMISMLENLLLKNPAYTQEQICSQLEVETKYSHSLFCVKYGPVHRLVFNDEERKDDRKERKNEPVEEPKLFYKRELSSRLTRNNS